MGLLVLLGGFGGARAYPHYLLNPEGCKTKKLEVRPCACVLCLGFGDSVELGRPSRVRVCTYVCAVCPGGPEWVGLIDWEVWTQ